MQLVCVYSELLESILVLRQIFSNERFRPFNDAMENLMGRLNTEDLKQIEDLGILTNGYLSALSHVISLYSREEINDRLTLLQLSTDPSPLYKKADDKVNDERVLASFHSLINSTKRKAPIFKKIWSEGICREMGSRSRWIMEQLEEIAEWDDPYEALEYLQKVSQRFTLEDGKIHFHIKPSVQWEISSIEKILVMPSLYSSRTLTFWYSGNTLLFFISPQSEKKEIPDPTDMHLLYSSALNDRTRLKMLNLLAANHCTALELAEKLQLNTSTVSRHLKLFKDSGFVEIISNDGRQIVYGINQRGIDNSFEEIRKFINS